MSHTTQSIWDVYERDYRDACLFVEYPAIDDIVTAVISRLMDPLTSPLANVRLHRLTTRQWYDSLPPTIFQAKFPVHRLIQTGGWALGDIIQLSLKKSGIHTLTDDEVKIVVLALTSDKVISALLHLVNPQEPTPLLAHIYGFWPPQGDVPNGAPLHDALACYASMTTNDNVPLTRQNLLRRQLVKLFRSVVQWAVDEVVDAGDLVEPDVVSGGEAEENHVLVPTMPTPTPNLRPSLLTHPSPATPNIRGEDEGVASMEISAILAPLQGLRPSGVEAITPSRSLTGSKGKMKKENLRPVSNVNTCDEGETASSFTQNKNGRDSNRGLRLVIGSVIKSDTMFK
ncbi:hypothetical protein MIND_00424900 [Mycena indigotica]|uniref:Uncharacterized protein n=1 Tax=Mycena indigotica TaxID=2126181 RepID=A0A8H6SWY0_9AGAR|nr:uncharacterized protein MIND_00424900 [Mycena indigotica]KAF7306337.1 hypothetical protein MIND_00424900 [Mycena indigotica]